MGCHWYSPYHNVNAKSTPFDYRLRYTRPMAANAQSIGRLLSKRFPANSQGVRPYIAKQDGWRVIVLSSTHSMNPANSYLSVRGHNVKERLDGMLEVWN